MFCITERQKGDNHSWFPKNWSDRTVIAASKYVLSLKKNKTAKEGQKLTGTYKGVSIIAWVWKNGVSSIFPDAKNQPTKRSKK